MLKFLFAEVKKPEPENPILPWLATISLVTFGTYLTLMLTIANLEWIKNGQPRLKARILGTFRRIQRRVGLIWQVFVETRGALSARRRIRYQVINEVIRTCPPPLVWMPVFTQKLKEKLEMEAQNLRDGNDSNLDAIMDEGEDDFVMVNASDKQRDVMPDAVSDDDIDAMIAAELYS